MAGRGVDPTPRWKGPRTHEIERQRNRRHDLGGRRKELGASLAGIARVEDLKKSRSFEIYDKKPYYDDYKGVEWKPEHKSVLVWALAHPALRTQARLVELQDPGPSPPAIRVLRKQSKRLRVLDG